MAISFIGAESTDGTSTTIPAHQAGDLLLFNSFRDGSNSTPTKPADITQLDTNTTNSAGSLSGYKIAASGSETSGTWTNATEVSVMVFRGVNQANPIGDHQPATGSSTTISFPALTMVIGDGTSWVAGMAYHRSTNCDLAVIPSGMSLRLNEQNGADEVGLYDTNAGVSSWSLQTTSVGGTASGWFGTTVEIRAAGGNISVIPSIATLAMATSAPTVTASDYQLVTPSLLALATTTFTPTVNISNNQTVSPTNVPLSLSTFDPNVSVSDNVLSIPDTCPLIITTFTPSVTATGSQSVTPSALILVISLFSPIVSVTDNKLLSPRDPL